jgi:hypothetical protein
VVGIDALLAAVLTEEAEETCDLLMVTSAEHERLSTLTAGWAGDPTSSQRVALSYVMRFVVLVEVFAFQRTLQLSDVHAGTILSPVFDKLYAAHRKRIEDSWDNALAALTLWPGVSPKNYAEYPALRGYILARNSWAHGYGRLTQRQVNDWSTTEKHITAAGFSIVAEHVVVHSAQVRDVARTCRSFVKKLDRGTSPHF